MEPKTNAAHKKTTAGISLWSSFVNHLVSVHFMDVLLDFLQKLFSVGEKGKQSRFASREPDHEVAAVDGYAFAVDPFDQPILRFGVFVFEVAAQRIEV